MFTLCPQDLGIILTYRCHSGCKHCLYNCGPRWENVSMTSGDLRAALEMVAVWPQRPRVHLTGGEPFLQFPLLLEGAAMAAELGIYSYVETSASWCTDEDEAVESFVALHDAGLQAVLISCSPFHAERIPPLRTLMAARAALEVFGPHRVMVYQTDFLEVVQRFGIERATPLTRYEEMLGDDGAFRLLWQGYGLISGGRSGYALGHLVPRRPVEAFAQEDCAGTLLYAPHSHFDLYGNFIPGFCGGLVVGEWQDLPQLLANVQAGRYPPLIEILVDRGPYGLCQLAVEQFGYVGLEEGYAGKCHLCVDVRRHLSGDDGFRELRPRGFYDNF